MGLRDWVSEKGSSFIFSSASPRRFNGAPRLGLGEGIDEHLDDQEEKVLQWGSETGSRRRNPTFNTSGMDGPASMGLRDWVSEKDVMVKLHVAAPIALQWGSETGSRRRILTARSPRSRRRFCFNGAPRLGLGEGPASGAWGPAVGHGASMGLRDWVSEKVLVAYPVGLARQASMGLRDWVSEKAPFTAR